MQKSSVNKVILVGNLGQDPESRFTPQGTAVTNLSIATNETWKDQNGETQDRTEWHRVVVYGRMAETAVEYMRKGQMVYVEGRLNTREWEDQNQVKRKTTEIRCDNFTMLGRRSDSGAGGGYKPNQNNPEKTTGGIPQPTESSSDDDLPF
tara:strand:- start:25 stop:474 length:450 start_codon:yes stop_codon:yes gene_type:complete